MPVIASAVSFEMMGKDWRPYLGVGASGSIATVGVEVPEGWDLKRAMAFGGIVDFSAGIKHERTRLELNYFGRASLNDSLSWMLIGVVSASSESGVIAHYIYDWVKAGFFSMYIGGGLGISWWKQSTSYIYHGQKHYERSGTNLVWDILTGMSFTIMDTVSIDLGMGWQQTQGIDFKGMNFRLGLRYTL